MAYTLAQNPTAANGGGASSISKAFASTVTAHSLLVAFITTDATTPGTFTVTGGGTWASIAAKKEPSSGQWLCIGYCLDATGGTAPTVQASWTGNGNFNGLLIAEFTNSGVASLFDTNTAGSTGSSTAPTDSAMTAADADAVVSYAIGGSSASPTVGATFTYGTNQDTTDLAAWEYKILAGPGSVTAVFAITPSQAWGIISAAFKPAATGGGPGTGSARPGKTWQRKFKHRQTPALAQAAAATPSTNAPADVATGTGSADNAAVDIDPNADVAAATGAAPDATAALGGNADVATATGTALDATVSTAAVTNAPAEAATGTGAANDAQAAITVNADVATATGSAPDGTGATGASAGVATGTGSSQDPTPAIAVNAEAATGTGAALDATVSTAAQTNAPADIATATGSAPDPAAAVGANAGVATGTGSSLDATVSTAAQTNAPADVATGTGTAPDPAIAITIPAGVATGSGAADAPTPGPSGNAGLASGAGTAFDTSIAVTVVADVASSSGAALDPIAIGAAPGDAHPQVATGSGGAYDARPRKLIPRPFTGTTARPNTGTTARPATGTTTRPNSGRISRPNTGVTLRP